MNRLHTSLLQGTVIALATFCGLPGAAQAQRASPPPGKALIVLYRADKQPVAARVPVIANADRLGDLGNGEFINAIVNPGRTFLRVGDRVLTTLAIQTSANRTSYVLVEAVPGQTPVRVEMRETNEAIANRALAQSRPAAAGAAVAAAAPRAAASAPAPTAPAPRATAPVPALAAAPAPRPQAAPAPQPRPAAPPPPQRQAQAAPPPKPAPKRERPREPVADEGPEWTFAVIAKTGAFKLATGNQNIGGLPSTYDTKSKPLAAIEGEFRRRDGYALGGELLYYKNTFTPDGTALKGDQTVTAAMLNAKYYLEATRWLYPFAGVGLGYATAGFGGDFTGKAASFAFQAMAGADIRFSESVGLYLEYKYFNAPTRDDNKQEIKAGGSGILVGLSFIF